MAKQNKIEKYGCQETVRAGIRDSKSIRQIAEDCSQWAGEAISHAAVARYLGVSSAQDQAAKKQVIVSNKQRVLKTVNQEIDIIQTNLDTTKRMIERFELVDDLPKFFREEMDELTKKLLNETEAEFSYVKYIESWQQKFEIELRRKIAEISVLNREVRENMKFTVTLREKAFQFELVQEYIRLFMEIFQEESKDGAYERSIVRIASNPRMRQLTEQQKLYTGGGD